MRLKDFINEMNSLKRPVILLEGRRRVRGCDEDKLKSLGRVLAELFPQAFFRSGNAKGSDSLFIEGVKMLAEDRVELIIPRSIKKLSNNSKTVSLDSLSTKEVKHLVSLTGMASPDR
ncbi:MAG: hypothetical protein D6710_07835, partial [Nitrospirae bacterium]